MVKQHDSIANPNDFTGYLKKHHRLKKSRADDVLVTYLLADVAAKNVFFKDWSGAVSDLGGA